jgi:hypothetical protein
MEDVSPQVPYQAMYLWTPEHLAPCFGHVVYDTSDANDCGPELLQRLPVWLTYQSLHLSGYHYKSVVGFQALRLKVFYGHGDICQ